MADIAISAATQVNLAELQESAALADRLRERFATGIRVNRPSDDAPAFFLARTLTDRAGDLLALKDDAGQAASAIGGAIAGIDSITDLVNQARALAASARGGTVEARQAVALQFDEVRRQIDALAADVGFAGVRLLAPTPSNLTVEFNESGTSTLTVAGIASDAASLGIGTAAGDFNGFAADTDIDAALNGLDGAVTTLRSSAASLGSNLGVIDTRLDFTDNLAATLESAASTLIDADINEDAAALLSLEVRNELALVVFGLARQSSELVLDLVRDA